MKRLSLSCVALLAGLGILQLSALGQNTANPKTKASSDVVISEVCYWPKKDEVEWIELANVSDKAVDIKGWQLVDGQSLDFVVSEKPLSMPPKSYLVVKLDGAGQPSTPFNQNKAVAHSPHGVVGNLLGDKGGHIALYAPQLDQYHPPEVRSYVAWGRSPGRIISDATKSERWLYPGTLPDAVVLGTGPDLLTFPVKSMQQGGTIGLVLPVDKPSYGYEHWGVFGPSETNPGRLDTKRGVMISPLNSTTTDEKGDVTLSVVWMEEGIKYQFQVCADKNFQQIFLDATREHANYALEKPIPLGNTYYWRARLIFPDGSRSSWSEIRSIINVQPK